MSRSDKRVAVLAEKGVNAYGVDGGVKPHKPLPTKNHYPLPTFLIALSYIAID